MSDKDTLISAIEKQMEWLAAEHERLLEEEATLMLRVQATKKQLRKLYDEYRDLERVHGRYADGERPERRPKPDSLGPSEFVLSMVAETPMRRDMLVSALTEALTNGKVPSKATDKRKLASSLVGNMIKRERLIEKNGVVTANPEASAE